jgi:hypothetical protein
MRNSCCHVDCIKSETNGLHFSYASKISVSFSTVILEGIPLTPNEIGMVLQLYRGNIYDFSL